VFALLALAALAWDPQRMRAAAGRLDIASVGAVQALRDLIERGAGFTERAKLESVNRFFNARVLFRDDIEVWGKTDYWASPLELLGRGAGDCEDFAIAKYLTLVALGVPVAKLRLVYVRARIGGLGGVSQAHMVLAYYPTADADPLVADNLIEDMRPASRRSDLTPVFSFNSEGLWQGARGEAVGDPVTRLSPWRDLLVKARAEGFLR
jgi:predicted transglutaminase-like cysteine proteinase